jgi:hypothetical protein
VGHIIFIPVDVSVGGVSIRAVRPFAIVLALSARSSFRPVIQIYRFARSEFSASGFGLMYMVPNPRFVWLLRMLPSVQAASFPLWSLPLPMAEPRRLPEGVTARPLSAWDDRIDRLWDASLRGDECGLVRDARVLRVKVGAGDHTVTEVLRGGDLAGVVASKRKGDGQWLICDMLVADRGLALDATLRAACNVAQNAAVDQTTAESITKAGILGVPFLDPALTALGFRKDDYTFSLVVDRLDPALDPKQIAPERWYVSAND